MHRMIVVGRGLVDSAAGRHLSALTDGVAVLGPDEPTDRAAHTGVFASHYDEGRITRVVDPEPAWAVTAKRSIERYAETEARSGIRFFTNAGYLAIGAARSDRLDRSEAVARMFDIVTTRLDAAGIAIVSRRARSDRSSVTVKKKRREGEFDFLAPTIGS